MSCSRIIRTCNIMAILILMMMEQGAAGTEVVALKDLHLTEEQLHKLASDVCTQLFKSEDGIQKGNITSCTDNFLSPDGELSALQSKVQIKCRKKAALVTLEITPLEENKMVILVPKVENEIVLSKLIGNYSTSDEISVKHNITYALWITVLNRYGTPSGWLRGPNVEAFSKVFIEEPIFNKYNDSYDGLNITFRWNFVNAVGAEACTEEVIVANNCGSDASNSEKMSADMPRYMTVHGVPLERVCSFQVFKNGEEYYTKQYRTKQTVDLPGHIPPPDKPKNIYIDATEDSSENGWDVFVSWSRPNYAPEFYNVTLRADGVHHVILSGNATEVTFDNVTGVGLYNVSVDAISSTRGNQSTSVQAVFPSRGNSSMGVIMAGAWSGVLFAAAALLFLAVCYRRRQADLASRLYFMGLEESLEKECSLESGQDCVVKDGWEVRSERLLLHEVIGEGAFGVVRRGTLAPASKQVAVKMLKDFPTQDEIRSFREEMELMKSVGAHPHVVSLVGCCSGRRPLIIAEYCSRGDLLSFLRCTWDIMVSKRNAKYYNNNLDDYRNDLFKKPEQDDSKLVVNKLYDLQGVCDAELTCLDLLSFCRQIVMGMEFLASNRLVHRDLAARNVLVSGDKTLKIADFGLSRDVYQENQYKQKGNGKMPVKWMALESLSHRIYTTQSDVWSFGVVIWEVVTVGGAPYPDVPAARLPRLLRAGYRMPRPNNCSKQLYEVMSSCWRARPRDRPTFAELHATLDELLNSACADEYLSLEVDADEAPPTPKAQRYIKMFLRGNRVWARGESYERPLKAPQSNHYTSPPAPLSRPQAV